MVMSIEERKSKRREASRQYRKDHPDKTRAVVNKWRKNHPDASKKWHEDHPDYSKNWDLIHADQVKVNHKKNRLENPERSNEYAVKHRLLHPEKAKAAKKKYEKSHPEKLKEEWKKHAHRRQRELGFEPLNSYFPESNAHHIDTKNVIYIPKPLHLSIPHDQKKSDSMKKINILAWDYLESSSY